MEAFVMLVLTLALLAFCFWKYPAMMKEIFSFKPKPKAGDKPVSTAVERMPQYGDTGYEDIGFINEPIDAPVVSLKHQIVQHRYSTAFHEGYWPEWVCKCGATGDVPVHYLNSLEEAQRDARRDGQAHVKNANKAEEMLRKTNGNFAW